MANPLILVKELFQETFSEWSKDKASRLAAALSYYTIFSVAPLLVIAIAVAGLVFGRKAATDQIVYEIRGLVGDQGAQVIQTILQNASKTTSGILATVVGIATLLLGASGAFGQLQDSLNTIWEVKPKAGRGVKGVLRDRFLSFSMVLVIGFLLMVSLLLSALLSGLGKFLSDLLPMSSMVMQAINFGISFGVTTILFALIFKVLPDAYVRWRDVWVGAAVTALLFSLGRFLIGLYLGRASVSSAYGAAGSLVVVLLWVYYSAQILFLGAEFTQVYAKKFGKAIVPKPNAERLYPPAGTAPA
ncbi:MAG: ribonuclease [Fibrobacteres bacterium]|nr:ribonuclease [Fibrobacterota bacterium]